MVLIHKINDGKRKEKLKQTKNKDLKQLGIEFLLK